MLAKGLLDPNFSYKWERGLEMVSLPCWPGLRTDVGGSSSLTSPHSWNFSSLKGGQGEVSQHSLQ